MVMIVGKNGQAQKMERQASEEQALTLRLFETLAPDWLPLWAGESLRKFPRTIIAPCRSFWTR